MRVLFIDNNTDRLAEIIQPFLSIPDERIELFRFYAGEIYAYHLRFQIWKDKGIISEEFESDIAFRHRLEHAPYEMMYTAPALQVCYGGHGLYERNARKDEVLLVRPVVEGGLLSLNEVEELVSYFKSEFSDIRPQFLFPARNLAAYV